MQTNSFHLTLRQNQNPVLGRLKGQTADKTGLSYMQGILPNAEDSAAEEKKQQKLQHIMSKLKRGKKLTPDEMEFLRKNFPDDYQRALRIQKMAEMLKEQLEHAKSKQEANTYIASAINGIADEDPDKECLVAAYNEIAKDFRKSPAYNRLPDTVSDAQKQRKHTAKNKFEWDSEDDERCQDEDLMTWTPLQEIIDAAPTIELKC